jgi:hypothetical protein
MPTITITLHSGLPPQSVLAAAVDFSERRSKVFPAVEEKYLTVHGLAETGADVTEGTGTGIGVSWERCRYEWPRTGTVTATLTEFLPAVESIEGSHPVAASRLVRHTRRG